jgi:Cysteine rich repeat
MVVRRIARWSLVITMLFAVSAAVAQTGSLAPGAGGGGKFRAACGQDVQQFCVGVQPGGGRVVQCLSSHTHEVSAACRNMVAAIHARRVTPIQARKVLPHNPLRLSQSVTHLQWETSSEHRADRMCKGFAPGRQGKAMSSSAWTLSAWNYRQLAARISKNCARGRLRKRILRTKSRRRRHQPRPRPRFQAMTTHPYQVRANR